MGPGADDIPPSTFLTAHSSHICVTLSKSVISGQMNSGSRKVRTYLCGI